LALPFRALHSLEATIMATVIFRDTHLLSQTNKNSGQHCSHNDSVQHIPFSYLSITLAVNRNTSLNSCIFRHVRAHKLMPQSPLDIQATLLFASLFGILHVIFTLRVGAYRLKNKINLGDGDDKELRNRIRAHGNFIENVPIALLLLLLNDLHGTSTAVLISVGTILLISRVTHYLTIASRHLPRVLRPLSMIGTLGSILVSALGLVVTI
jgi:uncharacterized membrane protein YecN with MAPEG domain